MTLNKKIRLVKEDTSGVISKIDVTAAQVSRDGLRAVDSGIFEIPTRVPVTQGNTIKYIQDVADTRHLRGAYLFQGSCMDESGYNVDPENQTHFSISAFNDYDGLDYEQNTTSGHKFENLFQGKVNSSGNGVILENKTLPNGNPVHDFSGDFEIFAWVTTPDGDSGSHVIYSKADSLGGVGISLRLVKYGSNYYARADMKNDSGSGVDVVKSQSTSKYVAANTPCCIRLQRIGETAKIWLVNGTEDEPFARTPDGTKTYVTGNIVSTKKATIGSNGSAFSGNNPTSFTNKFDGKLHSLRIYCGSVLDDNSARQIFSSRPIPLIMKLAGNVWKIEKSMDKKKIYVKGFGKVIIDTIISDQILNSGTATGEFYEYSGSRSTTSFTNAAPREIIRAIFAKLNTSLGSNPTFKLSVRDLTGTATAINSYTAEGNMLEVINQLMMIVNKSFYVSPRGKCIIENKDLNLQHIKFSSRYRITMEGFDDTATVNDLYVSTRAGGSFGTVTAKDTTSINSIGIYSKRVLAPQLTDSASVQTFKTNFLATAKDINTRYTIQAPFLLDFVRENFSVKIINTKKSLNANSTIKSISWFYPDGRTVIETGDYLLDAFDMEKFSSETVNNLFTDKKLNP